MGKMFVVNNSFELARIEKNDRSNVLESFCSLFSAAHESRDRFLGTDEFFIREYSFGTLCENLIYSNWTAVVNNPQLEGISSTVHNLIYTTLMPLPSVIKTVDSVEQFLEQFGDSHYGYTGLKMGDGPHPFVWCKETLDDWRCNWLRLHQGDIVWKEEMDDYLPNLHFSNKMLLRELKKELTNQLEKDGNRVDQEKVAQKLSEILAKHEENVTVAFYEEVIKIQGDRIEAYVMSIGTEIAEANFYLHDEELSIAEQARAGGSFRRVFRLVNRTGRCQYISLDFRHGMFEYHDEKGVHLGEKRFDGTPNKIANLSHNLKSLK